MRQPWRARWFTATGTPWSWDAAVAAFCVAGIVEIDVVALFAQLPAPTPVTLGAGAQIALRLIDQAPTIITALAALTASLVGLLNYRRLGKVQSQTNGHMTAMLAKQNELADKLADSVPAAAMTAVAKAASDTAVAASANHAAERAADRVADRASDRAADRAATAAAVLVPDRRADATPIKVDIVSTPESKATDQPKKDGA